MDMTDARVVERVQQGDTEAFRHLVERHARGLYRVGYRMMGNSQDADDIVQETFLRAYRQIAQYDSRALFSTWIHRIATNCAIDMLRSRKRMDLEPGNSSVLDEQITEAPSPDRMLLSGEINERVSRAMEQLSGHERTAFVLRHFDGMSIEEIGSILGTSINATKNTIFRAVKKLRHSLQHLTRNYEPSH